MRTTEECRSLAQKVGYSNAKEAFELLTKNAWGPSEEVWAKYPIPINPVGRVPFEADRQLLAFALPFAIIGYGCGHWGMHTMLLSVPFGIVLLMVQYKLLNKAIEKKRDAEWPLDRGRYRRTQAMSEALGIPPQELTLEMVKSIGEGFSHVDHFVRQAQQEAAESEARRQRRSSSSYYYAGGAVQAGVMDGGHDDDHRYGSSSSLHQGIACNPANGLPMAGGGTYGVDVGGNAYGSNGF